MPHTTLYTTIHKKTASYPRPDCSAVSDIRGLKTKMRQFKMVISFWRADSSIILKDAFMILPMYFIALWLLGRNYSPLS